MNLAATTRLEVTPDDQFSQLLSGRSTEMPLIQFSSDGFTNLNSTSSSKSTASLISTHTQTNTVELPLRRKFKLVIDKHFSQSYNIQAGVPQDGVIFSASVRNICCGYTKPTG